MRALAVTRRSQRGPVSDGCGGGGGEPARETERIPFVKGGNVDIQSLRCTSMERIKAAKTIDDIRER